MEGLVQRLKFAFRYCGAIPPLPALRFVAVVTLALSVGANTAIFRLLTQSRMWMTEPRLAPTCLSTFEAVYPYIWM